MPSSASWPSLLLLAACGVGSAAAAEPRSGTAPVNAAEARSAPRPIRSRHFALLSDVSDRDSQEILARLETMIGALERTFGRRQPGVIEGFVVHDLAVWPEGVLAEPLGVEKIGGRAGMCFTTVRGPERRATLYACDDAGILRHESTHGFCHLAFGGVGPPWLAEGLAEVGRWWRDRERGVEVAPEYVALLHDPRLPRPSIAEIVAPAPHATDDWREYARRWALCHFLIENPNHSERFRGLAAALMEGRPGASFESTFAPVARELAFEFDLFLDHVGNGARADLTAWPWKTANRRLAHRGIARARIPAAAGWRSSGVEVEAGAVYVITAEGEWRTAADAAAVGPDGAESGRGRLAGALFRDFALSSEIALGATTHWIAPADGVLMLRCADDWTGLADNDGTMKVTIRRGEAP